MNFSIKKYLKTETVLIVLSLLLIVSFYLSIYIDNTWSLFFFFDTFLLSGLIFLFVLYALYRLFYKKEINMIKPLLIFLFVFLSMYFRVDRFFVGKIDESEYLLVAYHEAPLGFAKLEIFKDSTFVFSQGGLGSKTEYKGNVIIKKDSLFFNYYDSIPVIGNKAVLSKYELNYDKHRRMETIYINRLTNMDSIK